MISVAILFLRAVAGLTVAAHGSQKVFGWFGGGGVAGATAMTERMGLRPARGWALVAGASELFGGLAVALGLLTPFAAMAVFAAMLMATTVHIGKGFFAQDGGLEYPLLLAVLMFFLAVVGPGSFSLDALLGIDLAGTSAAVAAFLLAVLGVVLALESKRLPQREGRALTRRARAS